jgi:pimeloyl-CoA synthetase
MNLFRKIKKTLGLKNKYAVKEIKEGGKLRGAVLLSNEERETLSKAERLERFKKWREEQS